MPFCALTDEEPLFKDMLAEKRARLRALRARMLRQRDRAEAERIAAQAVVDDYVLSGEGAAARREASAVVSRTETVKTHDDALVRLDALLNILERAISFNSLGHHIADVVGALAALHAVMPDAEVTSLYNSFKTENDRFARISAKANASFDATVNADATTAAADDVYCATVVRHAGAALEDVESKRK